jgi:hypothetical protein
MFFFNQTSLTFPKFFEFLNQYNWTKVRFLSQGPKRVSQDGTLTYQTFWIQTSLIETQNWW